MEEKNEPRKLTDEERADRKAELSLVMTRLAALLPKYHHPPIGIDEREAKAAIEEHDRVFRRRDCMSQSAINQ
jgi:hypothetical protein